MPDPTHDADDPITDLRTDWLRYTGDDGTILDALVRRHRERHRHYHTLGHTVAVLRHVDALASIEVVEDLGAVVVAAWYHDAVYEPRSPANERASARLARRDLTRLGWDDQRSDVVATMIEGTVDHVGPANTDTAVLFDADLAILGADNDVYAGYVRDVRAEYAHIDDDAWKIGRLDVLNGFLGRERIYATTTGFDRWESTARMNLLDEIDELRR